MKISIRFFLLATALLAISTAAPATPLTWQEFTYHYTGADKMKRPLPGQSAKLIAPEDPARPDGAKVELFLMRLPATTKTPGAPIVYLHGGPGGASLEHLESPDFRTLFDALRVEADVILLDQRGCGKSTPSLVPTGAPKIGPDSLASRASFLNYVKEISTLVRDRTVKAGHDPRLFTTLASVEDLEALRVALGAEKISLLAHSYGTQLAQAFARAHPASVARLVLIGSRGMDTARKLPSEPDAFLPRLAELAQADATVGAKFPDLMATLTRVLAKADRAPIEVPIEDEKKKVTTYRVGGYALRFILAKFYLNDPDNTRYLPKLLDEIDTGRRPWSLTFNVLQIMRSPVSLAWFTMDAANGVTPARGDLIRTQTTTALLGDAMNFPFPDINDVWHVPDHGDAFRASVTSDVPTLFVAGSLDGITPLAQTREIMRGFTNARLLVVENGGHNSQLRPLEVAAGIAGFFAGRTPPETARLPLFAFMPLIATEK
jgi:pimeloyl-ACP methyl ester carboxylesterase